MRFLQNAYYLIGTANRLQNMSDRNGRQTNQQIKVQDKLYRNALVARCWKFMDDDCNLWAEDGQNNFFTSEQKEEWKTLSKVEQLKEANIMADELEAEQFLQTNLPSQQTEKEQVYMPEDLPIISLIGGCFAICFALFAIFH